MRRTLLSVSHVWGTLSGNLMRIEAKQPRRNFSWWRLAISSSVNAVQPGQRLRGAHHQGRLIALAAIGAGASQGASVSTSTPSSGRRAATSRRGWALG